MNESFTLTLFRQICLCRLESIMLNSTITFKNQVVNHQKVLASAPRENKHNVFMILFRSQAIISASVVVIVLA